MTDAFEHLGIAPTRDLKTIKRAYAAALKAVDQASEREAFERLRHAYEQALAWTARVEDDEEEEEEEEEEEDNEDERENGQADHSEPGAPEAPPPTPPGDPSRLDAPSPFAPPSARPPVSPLPPVPVPQHSDDARQALRHWTDRLRDAAPGTAAAVLEAALADPRLLHLDSHAQLEARIAGLLHENPIGRAELFDTAARRFQWTDRNARPIASTAAAHWISRVVNQGLQWHAQAPAAIELQRQALDMAMRVASPQPEQTRRFADVLQNMASDLPDWFALHLGVQGRAHLPAWQASQARLAPQWARQAGRKDRYFGTRRKAVNTLVGGIFVLVLVTAVLLGVMNRLLGSHTPPATAAAGNSHKVGAGAPPATPEPVLAYEFTGAVTRDSCEGAEEFVHESNWLQIEDNDAIALLATRAMRCQDKGLWSRKDDTLMACLRAERAAALGAGRPEDAKRCLKPEERGR